MLILNLKCVKFIDLFIRQNISNIWHILNKLISLNTGEFSFLQIQCVSSLRLGLVDLFGSEHVFLRGFAFEIKQKLPLCNKFETRTIL